MVYNKTYKTYKRKEHTKHEAMPVGMGKEDDSKPLSFHSGLVITTDDYVIIM